MKSALIIYKSKTGFTKKYVDWILEDVKCSVTTLEKQSKAILITGYFFKAPTQKK